MVMVSGRPPSEDKRVRKTHLAHKGLGFSMRTRSGHSNSGRRARAHTPQDGRNRVCRSSCEPCNRTERPRGTVRTEPSEPCGPNHPEQFRNTDRTQHTAIHNQPARSRREHPHRKHPPACPRRPLGAPVRTPAVHACAAADHRPTATARCRLPTVDLPDGNETR